MLHQFYEAFHSYISNIVDVRLDGHCGYRAVATILGMGEDSWPLVYNNLHKSFGQCMMIMQISFGDMTASIR